MFCSDLITALRKLILKLELPENLSGELFRFTNQISRQTVSLGGAFLENRIEILMKKVPKLKLE